jgi:hypothetical protein
MITTNQQKKTLVDRLYRDNHITLDEVLMLLDDGFETIGVNAPRTVTPLYQGMTEDPAIKYPTLATSRFPSGVITNVSNTSTPTI